MFNEERNDSIKCRCCLEEVGQTGQLLTDEICEIFEAITKITLVPLLSSYVCRACSCQFDNIRNFADKLIAVHNRQIFLLNDIDNENNGLTTETDNVAGEPADQKSLKASRRRSKKQKPVDEYPDSTCPECGKKFTERRKIPLHIKRIHLKIKDFHCDQCDYSAYTRFDIVRHKKNIHAVPSDNPNASDKRICPDCGKVVRGNNQLTLHIRKKHLLIKKFQCDLCSFASYGKYEIRSHLEHIHVPKEFKESYGCSLCPSVLSSAMGLKVHMQHKHSGLRPHECFCGKRFSLRETLKTHIRNVHRGERKFACQFCAKRFGQAVRLRDHINNHHGKKQEIPCTQCSKIFHSSRNLKAHMVYHDEPKYACNFCEKRFYLSNKLKEHKKIHEASERDQTCNICNRSFQLLSSLNRHTKIHSKAVS